MLQEIMLQIVDRFGYAGICLLIAIENIFPPIPSEAVLTFGGFLTTISSLNVWGVILASTAGALIGAAVLYATGSLLSRERLGKIVDSRFGRVMHLKQGDIHWAAGWFQRHGSATVFFCRFIPVVRSLISIPAGMSKMRLRTFFPLTFAGTFIWNTVLVFLGRVAGSAWESVNHYVDTYSAVAIAILAVVCAFIAAWFIKKRFLSR